MDWKSTAIFFMGLSTGMVYVVACSGGKLSDTAIIPGVDTAYADSNAQTVVKVVEELSCFRSNESWLSPDAMTEFRERVRDERLIWGIVDDNSMDFGAKDIRSCFDESTGAWAWNNDLSFEVWYIK